MAAASAKSSKKFETDKGMHLTVSHEDILDTSAMAVAVGEDISLSGFGAVSKHLLEKCPCDYREKRDSLKKKAHSFEIGDVYPCIFTKKSTSNSSKTVGFNTVYIVIVPSVASHKQRWSKEMEKLYKNLFEHAIKDGKSSLALPLLGSGGAGASVVDAVNVFGQSLQDVRPSTLKDISLYINPRDHQAFREATAVIQGMFPDHSLVTHIAPPKSLGARSPAASSRFSAASSKNSGSTSGTSSSVGCLEKKMQAVEIGDDNSNLSKILGLELPGEVDVSGMKKNLPDDRIDSDESLEDLECATDNGSKAKGCHDEEMVDKTKEATCCQNEDDKCPICLDKINNPKKLEKCGHIFCSDCIEDTFRHHKPVCPTCNTVYGIIIGNQPSSGTMKVSETKHGYIPGYGHCGIIVIDYYFPSGIQGKEHPNPGCSYRGTMRKAYLPNNEEGRKVCRLLRVAFTNRLVFTVGTSKTTGADNVVTWNDIHHKTSIEGGPTNFGYPDPHYLSRVQEELAARGITENCLHGQHNCDI